MDTGGVARGAWGGSGCCGSEKEVNLYIGARTSFIGLSHALGGGAEAACWVLESMEVVMNEKRDSLSESDATVESPMPGVFLVTLSTRFWGSVPPVTRSRWACRSITITIALEYCPP